MKGGEIRLPKCVHFHVTLLVNSRTLTKSALKTTVEARKSSVYTLDETRSKAWNLGHGTLTNRVSCGQVHNDNYFSFQKNGT